MSRYFTAIDIPDTIKKELVSYFYTELKKYFDGNFVDEEKLHITLVFLGDIKIEKDFIDFIEKLQFSKMMTISGIGGFPSIKNPRVIYAEVHEELGYLAERISNFIGIPIDKEFMPHVTLCRVKKINDRNYDFNLMNKEFKFLAEGVHLFSSDFQNYQKIV